MSTEQQHIAAALALGCDTCTIEIDGDGQRHHQPGCELNNLRAEQERLSWILAGLSTAVLGYLKPEESYAGMPIQQIEEGVRLRMAFSLACEALKPFYSTARDKFVSTNDLMCELLRNADKRISELRSLDVPPGRARI